MGKQAWGRLLTERAPPTPLQVRQTPLACLSFPTCTKASSCHSTTSSGVQGYKIDHLWLLLPIKVGPMNPSELDPNIYWGICESFDLGLSVVPPGA